MSNRVRELYRQDGVILHKSHFVYSRKADGTWPHSDNFVDASRLSDASIRELSKLLFERIVAQVGDDFQAVMGPARGAIPIIEEFVRLMPGLRPIIAKRNDLGFFELSPCDVEWLNTARCLDQSRVRVVAVDDVLTKGTGIVRVARFATRQLVEVLALGCLMDRSGELTASTLGTQRFVCLWSHALPTFTEEECARIGPCSKGTPFDLEHGHAKEWLALQKSMTK